MELMQERSEREIKRIMDNLEAYDWREEKKLCETAILATKMPNWENKCQLNAAATRFINKLNKEKAVKKGLPVFYVQSASQQEKGMTIGVDVCD